MSKPIWFGVAIAIVVGIISYSTVHQKQTHIPLPPIASNEAGKGNKTTKENTSVSAQEKVELPPVVTEPELDIARYSNPHVMMALNGGKLGKLTDNSFGEAKIVGLNVSASSIYLRSFNREFSGFGRSTNQDCIGIYNPQIEETLKLKLLASTMGGSISAKNQFETGLNLVGDFIHQFSEDMGTSYILESQNRNVLQANAANDAAILIAKFGCKSKTVKRIYNNMEKFVLLRASSTKTSGRRIPADP